MRSHAARLAKLAAVIQPPILQKRVLAFMDYDEHGFASEFRIDDRVFTPSPGETEDELRKRGIAETGNADSFVMAIRYVRAGPNGGLAPGFERFAK